MVNYNDGGIFQAVPICISLALQRPSYRTTNILKVTESSALTKTQIVNNGERVTSKCMLQTTVP